MKFIQLFKYWIDQKMFDFVGSCPAYEDDPYSLRVRDYSYYCRDNNITQDNVTLEDELKFVIPNSSWNHKPIKSSYVARKAKNIDEGYKKLNQEEKIIKYKISFKARICMTLNWDKKYWNGEFWFSRR